VNLPRMADDPGNRDQRLQLYDVPGTPDDYGQPDNTGTLIGTFWGSVTNLTGHQLMAANQAFEMATHRIELGWLGSAIPAADTNPKQLILPRMYLIHVRTGRRFDVVFANNENEGNYKWILTCNEIVTS